MITLYLNCAQVWVRLVRLWCRVTRRPQVTYVAPPRRGEPPRGTVQPEPVPSAGAAR